MVLADPKPEFLGIVSVSVTPVAVDGPRFCTTIVYVSAWPTWPVAGPVLVMLRSAEDAELTVIVADAKPPMPLVSTNTDQFRQA